MADPRIDAFAQTAKTIINQLERHGMEGYFCETSADAVELVRKLVPEDASIAWGGTATFAQTGVKAMLEAGNYRMIDRSVAKTPEEAEAIYQQHFASDCFFMSTNAITRKGELVNIDGIGNRVAALCFGPKQVIVVAGMNKVAADLDGAVSRARHIAAPANAQRFDGKTPCAVNGQCGDCISPDCICSQMVITRFCKPAGRIKVVLVGEELGL